MTLESLTMTESTALAALIAETNLTDRKVYRLDVFDHSWKVEFHNEWGGLGRTAICVLKHDGPYIAFAGVAICSPNDAVDWQIGYKLAFKRAVEQAAQMYGTEISLRHIDNEFRFKLWCARVGVEVE